MSNKPVESKVNTVEVPATGSDPAVLYSAAERTLRIAVRNVGSATLFLAHDASTLQQIGVAGTFQLPVGAESVFVLQPRQVLVASAAGSGGLASIAVSEAMPQLWMEA